MLSDVFSWSFDVRQATHTVSAVDSQCNILFKALCIIAQFLSHLEFTAQYSWGFEIHSHGSHMSSGIVNHQRSWLRKCGILDLHAPLLEGYATCQGRLSNLICPPHYLIIRVFCFCRFGVGTPAIGEAVGFRRINRRPKQNWLGPHSSLRDISWYSSWLQQLNRSPLFPQRSKPKHFFTS